jgi:hypothetical protein
MDQDGEDPPARERERRPHLRMILGGGGLPSDRPEPVAITRSSFSAEGRARVLRAMRMLGAERAFLFVWDEQEFSLSEACACDETGGEPADRNVMWSLLDRITSQRAPVVMAGTDDQASDALMSGVTAPLRMAIAVPLLIESTLKGVVCFDKRIHKGQFVGSDVQAASSILERLSLRAEDLPALSSGVGIDTSDVASTQELVTRVRDLLGPDLNRTPEHALGAKLSAASEREVCFWHLQEQRDGGTRIALCRLDNQEAPGDVLMKRLLTCVRTFSLMEDAGGSDLLHALAFELERQDKELGYELHVTALELSADGAHSVWQAGNGLLYGLPQQGAVRSLVEATRPLSRGVRTLGNGPLELAVNERMLCVHGSESRAASEAPLWLSKASADSLADLGAIWLARHGAHASFWSIEPEAHRPNAK